MKTSHPLDSVHMSVVARERAKAQMQRAEFLVELAADAVSKVRSTVRSLFSSPAVSPRLGAQ